MVNRTSSRQAAQKANQAISQSGAGAKRQASTSKAPAAKRGKKGEEDDVGTKVEENEQKQQQRVEQTNGAKAKAEHPKKEKPHEKPEDRDTEMKDEGEEKKPSEDTEDKPPAEHKQNGTQAAKAATNGSAVEESTERQEVVPNNILEKGIIYFLFRPRVNVEDPDSLSDVARSFFVLRPIPKGAELGDGPIGDDNVSRLLMLPRKKFPTSGREREMGFVEKSKMSLKSIKDTFISGETYETKTRGEQHVPEAKPYAEGVYAITRTERSSHLAYILTIPTEIGDVQKDFGLRNRGSFVLQSKNPKYPGPSNAQLPKDPEYPKEVLDKFRDLRWAPAEPEFLDYPNAQFLMVGEGQNEFRKGGAADENQKEPNQKQPGEELETLEEENEERIESLKGDHSVFIDLGLDAKKYPQVPSTWDTT